MKGLLVELFFPRGRILWRNFILSLCLALMPAICGYLLFSQGAADLKSLAPEGFVYPAWVFLACWLIAYIFLGFSFYRVRLCQSPAYLKRRVYLLFGLQLLLNILFVRDYPGMEAGGLNPFKLYMLIFLAGLSLIAFYQAEKKSAWLFTPYALWLVLMYMFIF